MKKCICIVLLVVFSIMAVSVSAGNYPPTDTQTILYDDFTAFGTDSSPIAESSGIVKNSGEKNFTTSLYGTLAQVVERNVSADGYILYEGENFAGKVLSMIGVYKNNIVGGNWQNFGAVVKSMPYGIYAGSSKDNMTRLKPDGYTSCVESTFNSYMLVEYVVKSLPEGTRFIKIVLPSGDYAPWDTKIGRVSVTSDTSQLDDLIVVEDDGSSGEPEEPTPTPETGVTVDDLVDTSIMHSKTNNLGFFKDTIYTENTPGGLAATCIRRDGDSGEGSLVYKFEEDIPKSIEIDAFYYTHRMYAGAEESDSALVRLDKILAKEGIRLYESADGTTYTEAENVLLDKFPTGQNGLRYHEVVYHVNGLKSTTQYFKIVFPALPDNTVYAWSARIDTVKFTSGNTTEVFFDDLTDTSKILHKSGNVACYKDNVATVNNPAIFTATSMRRDGDKGEGYFVYKFEEVPKTISVDAYYYTQNTYAGSEESDSALVRLDKILAKEGIRLYESADDTTYTEITDAVLDKFPTGQNGLQYHEVIYNVNTLQPTTRYFKIVFPALPDNTVYAWSARVESVKMVSNSASEVMLDELADSSNLYEKSNGLTFESKTIATANDTAGSKADYILCSNRNEEQYFTYRLNTPNPNEILVNTFYYHQIGYAGADSSDSSLIHLEKALEKEGIKFYESSDNVSYTEVENLELTKAPSPWPGLTNHKVTYRISGLNEDTKYFRVVFPVLPDSTVYAWSARVDNVKMITRAGDIEETPQALSLPNVFMDNMMLQADKPIAVWGKAENGETVTATLSNGQDTYTANTTAAKSDEFILTFPQTVPASYTPYTLTVTDGTDTKTYENILFGDVYILAGQSNMAWTMDNYKNGNATTDERQEVIRDIAEANHPYIRYAYISQESSAMPNDDAPFGKTWQSVTPSNVGSLSAIGYYFAEEIQAEQDIPIGLISMAWGGTPISVWVEKASAYNNHIYPYRNASVKGILWYQGESDEDIYQNYDQRFIKMVDHYRDIFDDAALPFLEIQLARFGGAQKQSFHKVRELQLAAFNHYEDIAAATSTKNTVGMLSIINQPASKTDIHPGGKKLTASQVSAWAKEVIYGGNGEYTGPIAVNAAAVNSDVYITFRHTEGGILADSGTDIKGVKLAGTDGIYKDASVTVAADGKTLIASSTEVPAPVYVSYAYEEYPEYANIINGAGFAASPFNLPVSNDSIASVTLQDAAGNAAYKVAAGGTVKDINMISREHKSGIVIVGVYENNMLKAVKVLPLTEQDYTDGLATLHADLGISEGITNGRLKVMFLSSSENLQPITDVYYDL